MDRKRLAYVNIINTIGCIRYTKSRILSPPVGSRAICVRKLFERKSSEKVSYNLELFSVKLLLQQTSLRLKSPIAVFCCSKFKLV